MSKNLFLKGSDLADTFLSASEIPTINDLLVSAGFEDHSHSWWDLKNCTRNYARDHYQTASKTPGSGLSDWSSRTIRYELGLMALKFLEVHGVKYWGAPTRRELEYPRDKFRIAQILRQVFYRQNRNGETNARAKFRAQKTIETASNGQDSTLQGVYPASGRYPSPNMNHRQPTVSNMGGLPVQSFHRKRINFSIGLHGNETWQDTNSKSRDSHRNHTQEYLAPVPQIRLHPIQDLQADPAGFLSGLPLEDSSPARTSRPRVSRESNTGEGDDMYAPRQGSNRKRTASQQPEALHPAHKSTWRKTGSDDSGIIVISDEDSDAPLASISRNRHQMSPATTSKTTIKFEDAFISRLNMPASGPPDDGVLHPEVLEDGGDGQRVFPPNEEPRSAANEILSHPDPGLGASDHIHDQVTNETNHLDRREIEEHEHPSLPSPSASATTTRQHSRSAPKPEVQRLFFITTARTPRHAYTRWPEGTLQDKTLDAIFDEVAAYTSKKTIRKILFQLVTSGAEINYPIRRGDETTFDEMNRDFDEGIEMDREKGNTIFKIWLEPDPAG